MITTATPGQSLTIRAFEAADVRGVYELGLRCFDEQRIMAKEVWRYVNTPAGVIPGSVAVVNGRIVASYTAWPVTLCMDDERIKGAQVVVVMTDPDYQGQGLFTRLGIDCLNRMSEMGYEVVYGFPNDASYPGHMRRVEWAHIGNAPVLKRLILPGPFDPMPLISPQSWGVARSQTRDIVIRDEVVTPDTLAGIASRRWLNGIHMQRDYKWFDWRYGADALHIYKMMVVRTTTEPIAAIVYHREGSRVVIAELLGDLLSMKAGVEALIRQCRAQGVRVITTLTTDPLVVRMLRRRGFWFRGTERFIVKRLSMRLLRYNVFDMDNWRLFGGDHDVY
jgi:GNAT superfamily N-acetyltransferase